MTAITANSERPSVIKAWFLATRPRTLTAGFVPVAVGSAVAFREGKFVALTALAALVGALLIQIGTNLANDFFDFKKGADTAARLGPPRATQQGWLSPRQVFRGALACFAAAFVVGLYLVAVAGWPILLVGLVSIAAGYAYTGGPFPLAYNGLGDVFVLVFFGFVAVSGTYFVQAHSVNVTTLLCGLAVGCLGVALLAVNNTRDEATDRLAGKKTLVVRFGRTFGIAEWTVAVVVAMAVPIALVSLGLVSRWGLLAMLSLPAFAGPFQVIRNSTGAALNQALAGTAKAQLIYGVLLTAGLSI